jgi:hypothetical protein
MEKVLALESQRRRGPQRIGAPSQQEAVGDLYGNFMGVSWGVYSGMMLLMLLIKNITTFFNKNLAIPFGGGQLFT